VISVENGQATDLASLTAHVRDERITYPVLHDGDATNTGTYGVRAFPSAFVLNKNGRVVWEGVPMGPGLDRAEAAILKALGS
jgi:hypothetical protein